MYGRKSMIIEVSIVERKVTIEINLLESIGQSFVEKTRFNTGDSVGEGLGMASTISLFVEDRSHGISIGRERC